MPPWSEKPSSLEPVIDFFSYRPSRIAPIRCLLRTHLALFLLFLSPASLIDAPLHQSGPCYLLFVLVLSSLSTAWSSYAYSRFIQTESFFCCAVNGNRCCLIRIHQAKSFLPTHPFLEFFSIALHSDLLSLGVLGVESSANESTVRPKSKIDTYTCGIHMN